MCVSACNIDDASNGVVNKISIIVIPERHGKTPRGDSHDYNLVCERAARAPPLKRGRFPLGRRTCEPEIFIKDARFL